MDDRCCTYADHSTVLLYFGTVSAQILIRSIKIDPGRAWVLKYPKKDPSGSR